MDEAGGGDAIESFEGHGRKLLHFFFFSKM
jgi:hypothetical protein